MRCELEPSEKIPDFFFSGEVAAHISDQSLAEILFTTRPGVPASRDFDELHFKTLLAVVNEFLCGASITLVLVRK